VCVSPTHVCVCACVCVRVCVCCFPSLPSSLPPSITHSLCLWQADALVAGGFLAAGYNGIHLDGCWEKQCTTKTCTASLDGRDAATGALVGSAQRFPSGMQNLGEYFHNRSIKYALYTSESRNICGCPYAGSEGHEQLDADTFAEWGVE
jgi:alpha-galactosidase